MSSIISRFRFERRARIRKPGEGAENSSTDALGDHYRLAG